MTFHEEQVKKAQDHFSNGPMGARVSEIEIIAQIHGTPPWEGEQIEDFIATILTEYGQALRTELALNTKKHECRDGSIRIDYIDPLDTLLGIPPKTDGGPECQVFQDSSRMCNRGMKGCETRHHLYE